MEREKYLTKRSQEERDKKERQIESANNMEEINPNIQAIWMK